MRRLQLRVDNLRGLRLFRWSLDEHSVLVGPNGSGKTTALLVLKLLRAAYDRGLSEAVNIVFKGSYALKNRTAPEEEPVKIGVSLDDLAWEVHLTPQGASVGTGALETLTDQGRLVYSQDSSGSIVFDGQRIQAHERLALRVLSELAPAQGTIQSMATFFQGITVFHDVDPWTLREGTRGQPGKHLSSRGTNAVAMLRSWMAGSREDRSRYEFVLQGLRVAFPTLVQDLSFEEAGTTVALRVYPPQSEESSPLAFEANGLIVMLAHLCAVAGAPSGGLVAIDEPENSLHPYAIRSFVRTVLARARRCDLRLIFSTHSPVLLDQFAAHQVHVLRPGAEVTPTPLPELHEPSWLANFQLGELLVDDELGSNAQVD